MNQTFDLKNMGFAPMSETELTEVNGGSFWSWLGLGSVVAGVLTGGVGWIVGGLIAIWADNSE